VKTMQKAQHSTAYQGRVAQYDMTQHNESHPHVPDFFWQQVSAVIWEQKPVLP
jgi:hypothetical protein